MKPPTAKKQPAKIARRNVPPGRPPKGYQFLAVEDAIMRTTKWVDYKTREISRPVDSAFGLLMTRNDIQYVSGAFIRPIRKQPAAPTAKKLGTRVNTEASKIIPCLETVVYRLRCSLRGLEWTERHYDADIIQNEIIPAIRKLGITGSAQRRAALGISGGKART